MAPTVRKRRRQLEARRTHLAFETLENRTLLAAAGLVASWSFDEGSGTTVADSSGNGLAGTVSGASWSPTGRYGNALSFDGINDWVTVNDDNRLDLTNGTTLEAWVRPSSINSWESVVIKERSGGLAYGLYAGAPGGGPPAGWISRTGVSGHQSTNGTVPLALNSWSHLAASFDGSTIRLYVNGSLVSSQTAAGSLTTSSNPLRIGGNAVWGEYFAGLIDEVRVYNRALNQAEIQADMNSSAGNQPPTLSVGSISVAEGQSGITNATFTATLSSPSTQTVTVPYSTANSTAQAPSDYNATSGTLTFPAGSTSQTFTVPIVGDTQDEPNEVFVVTLGAATNATVADSQALGAILNDDSSLVAAYGFDEGTGTTVIDATGNGLDGTISGATWSTTGRFGNALSFNGTNSIVTVPDANTLDLTTGMTLEAWVRPSSVNNAWTDVIYKGLQDIYYLESASINGPPAVGGTFSGGPLYGTAMLTPNTWTHLAGTYDGANLRLYVNGVQVSSKPRTGSIAASNSPLSIGGDEFYGAYFAGLIDDVRIYNRALAQSEIQTDMNTSVSAQQVPHRWAPLVYAGSDASVIFGTSAILNGDVIANRPEGLTIGWTKVSGPGTVTFGNSSSPSTTASFSQPGVYELQLRATNNYGVTTDRVIFNVQSSNQEEVLATNTPLTVAEGATGTISSTRLRTTDADNTPAQLIYTSISGPTNGTVRLNGTATTTFTQADIDAGRVTFQHNGSETTSASFGFRVNDAVGPGTTGTFNVTVTPVNDEQVLNTNTGLSVARGASSAISSSRLATIDPDNTPGQLTYTVTSGPSNGTLRRSGTATTSFTQADINAGLITYQHNNSATTSDSFSFTVNDGQGAATSGTFAITVTAVNQEEVIATNIGLTLAEGATGTITSARLRTTDADNTTAQLIYTITSGPTNGTVRLNGTATTTFTQADIDAGRVTFQHNGSETTSASFGFRVNDAVGPGTTGTFNVTVTPVNDEQVLNTNTGLSVARGASSAISSSRLATIDPDNTPGQLTYTVTSGPSNGTLRRSGTATTSFTQADINAGLITYQHNNSATTSDSFSFTVNDGQGAATSGTFAITVTAVNQEEVIATNIGLTLAEGATGTITSARLRTTDADNTTAQLIYTITSGPTNGSVRLNGTATTTFTQADIDAGRVTFQHNGGETTSASFGFRVNDAVGPGTTGTFAITVTPVNDEQVLGTNNPLSVTQGATATITSSQLNTTDADNTTAQLTYTVTTSPTRGTLRRSGTATTSFTQADINAGLITYQHNGSATTSDSFTFTVNDGLGSSTSGTFNITITSSTAGPADSFEGSDPTGWDDDMWTPTGPGGTFNSGLQTTTEVTPPPGGGTHTLRQWWHDSLSSWAPEWLVHRFDSDLGQGDVFVLDYYLMLDPNFNHNGTHVKGIVVRNEVGSQELYINTHDDSGRLGVLFQQVSPAGNWLYSNRNGSNYSIPNGQWVHFRWEVKVSVENQGNPRNGYFHGWVNGVLRWEYDNINTIYSGQYRDFNTNATFNNPMLTGPNQKRYWDLFSVSTSQAAAGQSLGAMSPMDFGGAESLLNQGSVHPANNVLERAAPARRTEFATATSTTSNLLVKANLNSDESVQAVEGNGALHDEDTDLIFDRIGELQFYLEKEWMELF